MTEHFEYKEPKNKEVIWKEFPESSAMVDPWFLSDLLGLLKNSYVGTTTGKAISISSEDSPDHEITIFFDKKIFAVTLDFDSKNKRFAQNYTKQEYYAFRGFCNTYGFAFEEWTSKDK